MKSEEATEVLAEIRQTIREFGFNELDGVLAGNYQDEQGDTNIQRHPLQYLNGYLGGLINYFRMISEEQYEETLGALNESFEDPDGSRINSIHLALSGADRNRLITDAEQLPLHGVSGLLPYVETLAQFQQSLFQEDDEPPPPDDKNSPTPTM